MNITCKLWSAIKPRIGANIAINMEVNCDSILKTLALLVESVASPIKSTIIGLLKFRIIWNKTNMPNTMIKVFKKNDNINIIHADTSHV